MFSSRSPLFISAVVFVAGFGTVATASAATPAEDYVLEEGIMHLNTAGDFGTSGTVSRADFTKAVINELYTAEIESNCFRNLAPSLPVSYTHLFRDVPNTHERATKICLAMHVGLVNGDSDARFRPDDAITIAEASKILAKAYGLVYPSKVVTTTPWYWSSMEALRLRSAIASGVNPSKSMTRGEMAQMFYGLRNTPRFPQTRIIGDEEANIVKAEDTETSEKPSPAMTTEEIERDRSRPSRRSIRQQAEARDAVIAQ